MHLSFSLFRKCILLCGLMLGPLYADEAVHEKERGGTVKLNFNRGWGYFRGALEGAEARDYDDSAFVEVTLPHTARLERKHCNGAANVFQGEGWYRRYFTVDSRFKDCRINIDFEGVMIDSEVFINGKKVHQRQGGYIGFCVDVTDKINWDGENVIAVRFSNKDNPDTPPGRPLAQLDFHYYGGIYRDVEMRITPALHISHPLQAQKEGGGGLFVTYPEVSLEKARVNVKTHVVNEGRELKKTRVRSFLMDPGGELIVKKETDFSEIAPGHDQEFILDLEVVNPRLWHPDNPYLYYAVSVVLDEDNAVIDSSLIRAGIRRIDYKPDGFYINGEKFFIRGANRHQCYPYIGDAAPNSLQRRDAMQMKAGGFNSVRAAHYPQDPAFLDACDEIGLLVLACQPGWQFFGKSSVFYDNTLRDTREMIRRDRNHPSVILWETSLNETHTSEKWAREATSIAHREYPGGQIFTAADYGFHGELYDVCFKVVDRNKGIEKDADPEKPFFTREWGDWGHQSLRKNGEAGMIDQVRARQTQLNGEGYPDWGGLDACERIGGYWLWSWNDYPRGGSQVTLGSGAVDCDRYEKYSAHWLATMDWPHASENEVLVFIAGTNSPDSSLEIDVYSNAEGVRLRRNGKLVGELARDEVLKKWPNMARKGSAPVFTFTLDAFEPGELKAEAVRGGQVVSVHSVRTPAEPERIEWELKGGDDWFEADGSDLIPLHFLIKDKEGTVVPGFDRPVRISVEGEGELVGKNIPRLGAENQIPDGGIGFVYIRTTSTAGEITVRAECEGLEPAEIRLQTNYVLRDYVPGPARVWRQGVELLETNREPGVALAGEEERLPGRIINARAVKNWGASSMDSPERGPEKLLDGELTIGTGWLAQGTECPQSVTVQFLKPHTLRGSRIYWEKDSSEYTYDLHVSKDGSTWTPVLSDRKVSGQYFLPEFFGPPADDVEYVRITIKEVVSGGVVNNIGMAEWILYGDEK